MITAVEHDYDIARTDELRGILDERALAGWKIAGTAAYGAHLVLFWSKVVPATPNTTPPTETLSSEFEA